MVPLDVKNKYLLETLQNQKVRAFYELASDRTFLTPTGELNDSEQIYYGLVKSLQENNRSDFENFYNKKNKSNPRKEAPLPFVNDDYLIFVILIGLKKFHLSNDWMHKVLAARPRNQMTITFENILTDNFSSNDNLYEVIFIFLRLTKRENINNELLNQTYRGIQNNIELFNSKNDFQIICAIQAYNSIIELKIAPDGSYITLLEQFHSRFLKRINVLNWFLQTGIVSVFIFIFVKILILFPKVKDFYEKMDPLFTTFGILGLSLLSNVIPKIKNRLREWVSILLGYPKKLIQHTAEKNKKH